MYLPNEESKAHCIKAMSLLNYPEESQKKEAAAYHDVIIKEVSARPFRYFRVGRLPAVTHIQRWWRYMKQKQQQDQAPVAVDPLLIGA